MKEIAAAESNEVVYVLWHLIRLHEIITAPHLHAEASCQDIIVTQTSRRKIQVMCVPRTVY